MTVPFVSKTFLLFHALFRWQRFTNRIILKEIDYVCLVHGGTKHYTKMDAHFDPFSWEQITDDQLNG